MCQPYSDNSAVSEALGYILIFMIVVSCIAIILVIGNGVLDNAKSQNNFKGIEQGFMVVSSDLKQVALEGTPLKTTKIHLEGGSITANSSTNDITVTYNGHTYYNNKTGNITFRSSTSSGVIAIENGGLWEKYDFTGSDIMVLKPRIFNISDTNTLVLNIIRLNASGSSIGGSATVSITLQDQGTNVYPFNASSSDVEITLNTAYPQAWARFMEDSGAQVSGLDDHSFTAKFTSISKLIIIEHNVGVTLN